MGVTAVTLAVAYAFVCSYVYLEPTLPTVAAMKNNELAVPLRVYTRSGDLIAQIGEQRRNPVKYDQIPLIVRQAFIAAEDDRFFEHHGFDWQGILRSLFVNVTSGETQGGSTITMQAARSAFFTQEQTVRRKLQEAFVTYRLEREFTKQEILALYLNVIFFGQRAYGVAAAAETYFGKQLDELTLGEAATLARVPQWPSKFNPISNPQGATDRRKYVLRRMHELGFVDAAAAEAASQEVVSAKAHRALADVEAPYVAEMVRLEVIKRFGPQAQDAGYKVYTTLDGRLQTAANHALAHRTDRLRPPPRLARRDQQGGARRHRDSRGARGAARRVRHGRHPAARHRHVGRGEAGAGVRQGPGRRDHRMGKACPGRSAVSTN